MKWEKKDIDPAQVKELAAKFGCGSLTASILARRGVLSGPDVCYFLEDDPRFLHNPFLIPGMEDAVERILAAKEEGEKVLVFGDRDTDGVTSTALLTGFLRGLGLDVSWRVPVGDEPYGLTMEAVETFAAADGTLIITVDCGISNTAEVLRAAELRVDVIITDHHNPQEEMPAALAIVNPKLEGSGYPFRDLAGCGVAYKLVSALRFALKSELYGQSICLLNCRHLNDGWTIDAVQLRNLAVVKKLSETLSPGMARISDTRLVDFLTGQHILCWDADLQKKAFKALFGNAVEISMLDMAAEIAREIPAAAGKSLLRLSQVSALAKYTDRETGEIDVFVNLFETFARRRAKLSAEDEGRDLQLAAIGTVADIMPLVNENRIIARQGFKAMQKKPREGLYELLFKLDLAGAPIDSHTIAWQVAPLINSAGRMGSADKAAALLLEEDPRKREDLAAALLGLREESKRLGQEVWERAEPRAAEHFDEFNRRLAVVWGEDIIRGVTSITASKLVGRFKTPSLAAAFSGGIATGSLRSAGGYDLRFLLEPNEELFLDWGGHDYAAGFSMELRHWDTFLERLKMATQCMEFDTEKKDAPLNVDAELPHDYLGPDLYQVVDRFEPYGSGNPPLLFLARGLRLRDLTFIGKGAEHLRCTLDAGRHKWPAVFWSAAERVPRDFGEGCAVDVIFEVGRNCYKGKETPQIEIKDMRRTSNEAAG
ncbi:MAG: single-stranded-DNA-specific exonuclease RecJ [Treponema sp.]|jgi:single-stranded-DNA-specific exonuclease|nr:single-stranded-DNA-specific exonuclease RecJ [Treponema sp.]